MMLISIQDYQSVSSVLLSKGSFSVVRGQIKRLSIDLLFLTPFWSCATQLLIEFRW